MIVDKSKTIHIDNEHSIEFGKASWDSSVESIRRRKNRKNGSFDPMSSSEIPIDGDSINLGIGRLVCECLKLDKISIQDMLKVFKELKDSMTRQGVTIP
jgi:hypothetical protein